MKCKHTYQISGKDQSCTLHDFVPNVPIDHNGYCIFHSQELKWKIKNNFLKYLTTLSNSIRQNRLTTFGFHDFVFTGESIKFEGNHENKDLLYFNKMGFLPTLTFYDCTFCAEIELENCSFKSSVNFINCTFQNEVTLNGCTLFNELNIFDTCRFEEKLSFYNQNLFYSNVNIVNSDFRNDLDIDTAVFQGSLFIDENRFLIEQGLYVFSCVLNKGASFRNNLNIGLFNVEESRFLEQSLILNLSNSTSLQFSNNSILGEIRFQGNPESLLFNPNTVLEISSENFETNVSRIVFDYCDILNLSENLLRKLTEWEESEKVVLNESNKMSRFKSIHFIETRSINKNIIEDVCTLVTRFFQHLFNNKLTIRFERYITENKLKITIESKSLIAPDDFISKYSDSIVEIFKSKSSSSEIPSDLVLQKMHIFERIQNSTGKKLPDLQDVLNLICLNEKEIHINVADKIIVGNNVIDKAITLYLSESNIDQLNVNTYMDTISKKNHLCNIGIVVPLLEELNGLLKIFGEYEIVKPKNSTRTYYRVQVPTFDASSSFNVVLTLLNQMGNVESAICTMDMVNNWNPERILIIGIAGGFSRKHQKLGEVIIADSLLYFEEQKLKAGKVEFRPDMLKSDRELYNHARTLSNYPNIVLPKAHFGVIVSGEKVITDNTFKNKLFEIHSKLLGVEMESWGVAATVFSHFHQLGFLTIRGISDYADPDKNNDFREIAIQNAAIWAHSFIRSKPYNPIEINFKSAIQISNETIKELVKKHDPNFAFELHKKMNKSMDYDEFRIFLDLMVAENEGNLKGGTDEAKMANLIARFRRREKLEELYYYVDYFLKNR